MTTAQSGMKVNIVLFFVCVCKHVHNIVFLCLCECVCVFTEMCAQYSTPCITYLCVCVQYVHVCVCMYSRPQEFVHTMFVERSMSFKPGLIW